MVPRNFCGRDILYDTVIVISTDDKVFFDKFQVHEKTGLANFDPMHELQSL